MSTAIADSYIREIKSIDDAMRRINAHIKELRQQKKKAQDHLYTWMNKRNIDDYQGYKRTKLAPKLVYRKKESEKKSDALKLFESIGVTDSETLWIEFKKTQKVAPLENENDVNK